jgi:hypothetical protein
LSRRPQRDLAWDDVLRKIRVRSPAGPAAIPGTADAGDGRTGGPGKPQPGAHGRATAYSGSMPLTTPRPQPLDRVALLLGITSLAAEAAMIGQPGEVAA